MNEPQIELKNTVKHPKEFGFTLGLRLKIGATQVRDFTPEAREPDVVYVAILPDGRVLRVGQTGGTLLGRWNGIARMFGGKSLRPNEEKDRERLIDAAGDTVIEVWVKRALQIELPYAPGKQYSARGAEEIFLDHQYRPILGQALTRRGE